MTAIITKYHGPTNTRGARISATAGNGQRVSIAYPHELNEEEAHRQAADALCSRLSWPDQLAQGGLKHGYAFVFVGVR